MKCRVHFKSLIESTAFRIEGDWSPDDASLQILRAFPHSIHFDYSLQPDQWHKIPERISYCPDCESQARFARLARRLSEDA